MDNHETLCRAAVSIALEPHRYKLCVGCEMIVPKEFKACECGSYHFSEDVTTQLFNVLHDFPVLLGECKKMIEEKKVYERQSTKNN